MTRLSSIVIAIHAVSLASAQLEVKIDASGSYDVSVDGEIWLPGGDTKVSGRIFSLMCEI